MLTRRIGLRKAGASQGPRIHDIRHRFAVSTLFAVVSTGEKLILYCRCSHCTWGTSSSVGRTGI